MPGKNKNLLRNPCAKDGLDHWEVVCSGGDGFKCEEEPEGCKKICDCTKVKDNLPCWSTSHDMCEKFQLVYLPEFDISEEKLDNKKPPIRIRDWYGARFDSGCEYKISVRLLADDKSTELDAWNFSDTKEEGSDWTKVKHVFKGYPSGVRYVEFKHGGQDTKNWAGFFGVKMTNSGVFVGKKRSNRKKRAVRGKSGKNLVKNPCGTCKNPVSNSNTLTFCCLRLNDSSLIAEYSVILTLVHCYSNPLSSILVPLDLPLPRCMVYFMKNIRAFESQQEMYDTVGEILYICTLLQLRKKLLVCTWC